MSLDRPAGEQRGMEMSPEQRPEILVAERRSAVKRGVVRTAEEQRQRVAAGEPQSVAAEPRWLLAAEPQ